MSTTGWVILAIVAGVVVVALVAMSMSRSRRSSGLRDRFGPEYDRTVTEAGSRRTAEKDLRDREEQYESMDIQPLSDGARDRYTENHERGLRRNTIPSSGRA